MPAEKVASSRSAVRNGLVFRINRTPLDSAYSHSVEVWTLEMGFCRPVELRTIFRVTPRPPFAFK